MPWDVARPLWAARCATPRELFGHEHKLVGVVEGPGAHQPSRHMPRRSHDAAHNRSRTDLDVQCKSTQYVILILVWRRWVPLTGPQAKAASAAAYAPAAPPPLRGRCATRRAHEGAPPAVGNILAHGHWWCQPAACTEASPGAGGREGAVHTTNKQHQQRTTTREIYGSRLDTERPKACTLSVSCLRSSRPNQ